MDSLNGIDLFKTIKTLDIDTGKLIPESLDWLFHSKETNEFLNWLCRYVNETNIETGCELYEYSILQNENKVIPVDHLEEAVNEAECNYPGIFDVNQHEIKLLRHQIELETKKEDYYNKIMKKYLLLDSKVGNQLSKLSDVELNIKIKRQSRLNECEENGQKLDELHRKIYVNVQSYLELFPSYNTIQQKPFFFQIPLNHFQQECDSFNNNLNLWIKKEFVNDGIRNTSLDIDNIDKELRRVKYGIEESVLNNVKTQCALKGAETRLKFIISNSSKPLILSKEEQRIKEIQTTSRLTSLYEHLERLYDTELQQVAQNYAQELTDAILAKNAQIKLDKCRHIAEQLIFLNNEIKHALAQCTTISLLLKTDKTVINSVNKFLEDTYFYSAKYHKQYGLRHEIMHKQPLKSTTENLYLNNIIALLTESYGSKTVSLQEAQNVITGRKVKMEDLENRLFVVENQKYHETAKIMENDIRNIVSSIWCGPTLEPVIIPYVWLESLKTANTCQSKIQKRIRSCVKRYNYNLNILEKNQWLKTKRLLWAWYLVEPEKVPIAVDQIRKFAIEQVQNQN